MPQLINEEFASKLYHPEKNKIETQAFLAKKPQPYIVPDLPLWHGYELLATKIESHAEGKIQTICLIHNGVQGPITIYKLKLLMRDASNAYIQEKNCTQLLVWRTFDGGHETILAGFAKTMFNHLLKHYTIIISDEQQTEYGKRFWLYRMGESFLMTNRAVSMIDLNNLDDDMNPVKTTIHDSWELSSCVQTAWGQSVDHREKVFMIEEWS